MQSSTDLNGIHLAKLEDFNEYPVIDNRKDKRKKIEWDDLNDLPIIDIKPIQRDPLKDVIPDDPIFNEDYLHKYGAFLEEDGYFARGDYRSPEEMEVDNQIIPKCNKEVAPHYDIRKHQGYGNNTVCSGFISLTESMAIAHQFGRYYDYGKANGYFIYFVHMERGLKLIQSQFPKEREHTAIGPVEIVSYRKCFDNGCESIFIRKDISSELRKKISAVMKLPHETFVNERKELNTHLQHIELNELVAKIHARTEGVSSLTTFSATNLATKNVRTTSMLNIQRTSSTHKVPSTNFFNSKSIKREQDELTSIAIGSATTTTLYKAFGDYAANQKTKCILLRDSFRKIAVLQEIDLKRQVKEGFQFAKDKIVSLGHPRVGMHVAANSLVIYETFQDYQHRTADPKQHKICGVIGTAAKTGAEIAGYTSMVGLLAAETIPTSGVSLIGAAHVFVAGSVLINNASTMVGDLAQKGCEKVFTSLESDIPIEEPSKELTVSLQKSNQVVMQKESTRAVLSRPYPNSFKTGKSEILSTSNWTRQSVKMDNLPNTAPTFVATSQNASLTNFFDSKSAKESKFSKEFSAAKSNFFDSSNVKVSANFYIKASTPASISYHPQNTPLLVEAPKSTKLSLSNGSITQYQPQYSHPQSDITFGSKSNYPKTFFDTAHVKSSRLGSFNPNYSPATPSLVTGIRSTSHKMQLPTPEWKEKFYSYSFGKG